MKPETKTKPNPATATITELQRELAAIYAECDAMKVERNAAQAELAALQKQIADGKIRSTENPRWTPRAQAALELAKEEAGDQMASYVGTDHVLLGLLRQDDGISKRIFLAAGLTYEKAAFALRVSRCH